MSILTFSYWRLDDTLRTVEFPTTADYVKEIDTNDDIDTALPLDALLHEVKIGCIPVISTSLRTLHDLYVFCKGNIFGQNEEPTTPQPVEKGAHVCIEHVCCTIGDKADLINRVLDMSVGDVLDFHEIDTLDKNNEENCSFGTGYCIGKIKWQDSVMLLIGGYTGETLSAFLDSETFQEPSENDMETIKIVVNNFFDLREFRDNELIAIENIKQGAAK